MLSIFLLMASRSPPTLSSIRVSALFSMAIMAFLTSMSISFMSVEVPIVAFTLSSETCSYTHGFNISSNVVGDCYCSFATDFLINSSSTFSIFATAFICSVIMPFFASSICVIESPCSLF